MTLSPFRLLALSALAFAIAGCATRTQTIVVVDGDATVRADAATLDVRVLGPTGEALRTLAVQPGVDAPELPFTLALEPVNGDASRRFTVEVTAHRADGTTMTSARSESGYLAGRALELRVYLEMQCASITCSADTTCRGGRCGPVFVDPSTLPSYPSGGVDAASPGDGGSSDAARPDGGGLDGGGGDGGRDGGARDGGGGDAGPIDASAHDGGGDAGTSADAGADAGRDGGATDGGTVGTAGPLAFAGAAGASVEVRAFAADAQTVCFGGETDHTMQVGAQTITEGSSGLGQAFLACYDVSGPTPALRFARGIEPIGGLRVGAIALDGTTTYALVYADPRVARTFDGIAATSRAFALRLDASGTITAATPFAAETVYLTAAVVDGASLYVTDMDTFGNSGAVTRFDVATMTLGTTDYLTTGWNFDLALSGFGVVVGRDEASNAALVHRVSLASIRPPTWTLRSTSTGSESRAAAIDASDEIFVGGAARGDMSWTGDSHVTRGPDMGRDVVLTHLDADGHVLALERIASGPGDDFVNVVAREGTEVVMAGASAGLTAPTGLSTLPSDGGSNESWVIVADATSCLPTRWERLASTAQVTVLGGGVSGGWLYLAGTMRGTTRALSSSAFGASGATTVGVQDGFLVRVPIP